MTFRFLLVGYLWLGSVHGADTRDLAPTVQSGESRDNQPLPHPWLQQIPPHLARMVDVGHVQIQVNDRLLRQHSKMALTLFDFQSDYSFRYQLLPQRAQPTAPVSRLRVVLNQPRTKLTHTIVLGSQFQPVKPWHSPLLLHEFDHVAISTDPRFRRLLTWLDGKQITRMVPLAGNLPEAEGVVQTYIQQELNSRTEALRQVTQEYYRRLDADSREGTQPLSDRARFFLNLYTLHDLRGQKFPYCDEVAPALAQVNLQAVRQHYLLVQDETQTPSRDAKPSQDDPPHRPLERQRHK